jgi:hypothetical protein
MLYRDLANRGTIIQEATFANEHHFVQTKIRHIGTLLREWKAGNLPAFLVS